MLYLQIHVCISKTKIKKIELKNFIKFFELKKILYIISTKANIVAICNLYKRYLSILIENTYRTMYNTSLQKKNTIKY